MRRSCPHEPLTAAGPPRTGLGKPRSSLTSRVLAVGMWLFARLALFVDRHIVSWHRLPAWPGLMVLLGIRIWMRTKNQNLFAAASGPAAAGGCVAFAGARTADGTCNDEVVPAMGSARTPFGRNVPAYATYMDHRRFLVPNPRRISNELLARTTFQPAGRLNLLAAAWIQFMVHDWFSHGRNPRGSPIEVPIEADDDPWPARLRPMRVRRTRPGPRRPGEPPVFLNTETHWWDASQIYGSSPERQRPLRTRVHGTLRLDDRGLLPGDDHGLRSGDRLEGLELTGVNANWWIGLSLLHTLFVREHNAICEHLRARYPAWCDDALFEHARLVNAALIAKIHTLDWTPAILNHPAVRIGMKGNWWGLATERVHRLLGRLGDSEVVSGIPGSPMDHQGVPFSITEEFVAVYRMHPLLPDDLAFWSAAGAGEEPRLLSTWRLPEVAGWNTRNVLNKLDLGDVAYSFGRMRAGKIGLGNYPTTLREIEKDGVLIDLATIDVLRDRERGIPRYNEFRKLVHRPPIHSFAELNPEWAERLAAVYTGGVDDIDLMVGLLAETPPEGFGFSDTAFRIFILMASRRFKSDRFFTDDYRPEVYTPEGIAWIEDNDMRSVLLRHFGGMGFGRLEEAVRRAENVFFSWR
jgi:heme peroxidase